MSRRSSKRSANSQTRRTYASPKFQRSNQKRPGNVAKRLMIWGGALLLIVALIGFGVWASQQVDWQQLLAGEPTRTPFFIQPPSRIVADDWPTPVATDRPLVRPTTPPVVVPPADTGDAQADRIIALTNALRARNGLQPLSANALLTAAAQQHNDWMAANDVLSHEGAGGSSVGDRATANGYRWRMIGENILYRWDLDADGAYDQWLNSPPHRDNMLTPEFTQIGIAHTLASNGRYYYTMVLGTSR